MTTSHRLCISLPTLATASLLATLLSAAPDLAHAQATQSSADHGSAEIAETPAQDETPVSDDWLSEVSSSILQEEMQFTPLGAGLWGAGNPPHKLRSRLDRSGIEVSSFEQLEHEQVAAWQLRLQTVSFGRVGEMQALECRRSSASAARAELDYGVLVEWFLNDERGIEQGWTIAKRPAGTGSLAIGIALEGDLSLRLAEGGRSGLFVDRTDEACAQYRDLAAWDANGRQLDAWMVLTPAGVEVQVDDSDACYPVIVDPLLTSYAWTAGTTLGGALFGYCVSAAGDVNGDGYADVIIGSPASIQGQGVGGRAYVYHGSPTGLGLTPAWLLPITAGLHAYFGASTAAAGDVNGDGYDDVIVGAPHLNANGTSAGGAFVYHGSATGLSSSAAWSADSDTAGANFGFSVSGAGDVNGDGFADVIVGAPFDTNGELREGRAFVFLGSATGLAATEAWTAESDQSYSRFGFSVSTAGDVNGDGYADVIAGAPYYDRSLSNTGRAFLYHGSAAGLSATAAWTVGSDQLNANYGFTVSTAGDVNGDGHDDVIVGAPRYTNGELAEGRAFAYLGSASGLSATAAWTAEPDIASAFFGVVAAAGDFNGDGFDDVIIGAPGFSDPASPPTAPPDEGRAFTYSGSAAGLSTTTTWVAKSPVLAGALDMRRFGSSVAGAGDVNGDGIDDLIVGVPWYHLVNASEGRAFAYHGRATVPSTPYCTAGTSVGGCIAQLSSTGSASATASSGFYLNTTNVAGDGFGTYYFAANGRQATPWANGNGFQCVAPPLVRSGSFTSGGSYGSCDGAYGQDLNALWCPTCPRPAKNPGAGTVVQAQLWYQDPLNTTNRPDLLSNAIEFTVLP